MEQSVCNAYLDILREELVPAMGCTEPIAVAYAGALARRTLGVLPQRVELNVSNNIIKNVKSVIVPHTAGKKGLRAAVAVGIVCGDADRELEVVSGVTDADLQRMEGFLASAEIILGESNASCPFDIQLRVSAGADSAFVRIIGHHTNVVILEKNGKALIRRPFRDEIVQIPENRALLSVERIVEFAETVCIDDVRALLQRQIDCNMAIAETGLREPYGANIGKVLLRAYGDGVKNRAKAWAAAGSDARMNGCEKPVVINSGSGNQGMTASIPVVVYARDLGAEEDRLFRALVVSNLITIHLKTGIGSLSAYCGATSAGAGAGAGICWLCGGTAEDVAVTVSNAIAINSGMVCDGAKASCAAKIASAVEAGLLGWQMAVNGSRFACGDGIVADNVENTIRVVSTVAREGMRDTDDKIIRLMMQYGS